MGKLNGEYLRLVVIPSRCLIKFLRNCKTLMVDLSSIIWLHYGVDRRLLDRIAYLESAIVLLRSDWVSLL